MSVRNIYWNQVEAGTEFEGRVCYFTTSHQDKFGEVIRAGIWTGTETVVFNLTPTLLKMYDWQDELEMQRDIHFIYAGKLKIRQWENSWKRHEFEKVDTEFDKYQKTL